MRKPTFTSKRTSSRVKDKNKFVENTKLNRAYPGDNTSRPAWYGLNNTDGYVRAEIEAHLTHANRKGKKEGEFKCCYCNNDYHKSLMEIEHIMPFSVIGQSGCVVTEVDLRLVSNDAANLTYACGKNTATACNQSKSDKLLSVYLQNSGICTMEEFFERTPWAKWMEKGNILNYVASWNRTHVHVTRDTKYNDARDKDRALRATSKVPRRPFKNEACIVNRLDAIIGSYRCIEKLCTGGGLFGLRVQDIKNLYNGPYVNDKYTVGAILDKLIKENKVSEAQKLGAETTLIAVDKWPR